MKDAGPAPTKRSANQEATDDLKQRNRAALLKQQYPGMKGVPPKIGLGTRRKLIAEYKAKASARAPSAAMPTSSGATGKHGPGLKELPARPLPPGPSSGANATRQRGVLDGIPANSSATSGARNQRPKLNKMAPLSEERRAEVARNLAAGSNSDPVMID